MESQAYHDRYCSTLKDYAYSDRDCFTFGKLDLPRQIMFQLSKAMLTPIENVSRSEGQAYFGIRFFMFKNQGFLWQTFLLHMGGQVNSSQILSHLEGQASSGRDSSRFWKAVLTLVKILFHIQKARLIPKQIVSQDCFGMGYHDKACFIFGRQGSAQWSWEEYLDKYSVYQFIHRNLPPREY